MDFDPAEYSGFLADLLVAVQGAGFHEALFKVFPPRDDATILEIGCGTGKLGLGYAVRGCDVVLADVDPEKLKYSRRLTQCVRNVTSRSMTNVEHVQADIFKLREVPWEPFDFVFNEGVLEHFYHTDTEGQFLAHDDAPLRNMVHVVKSGGTVAVFVPNATNPESQRVALEHVHHYVGMPEKEYPFHEDQVRAMFEEVGLTGVQTAGIFMGPKPPDRVALSRCRFILCWGVKP